MPATWVVGAASALLLGSVAVASAQTGPGGREPGTGLSGPGSSRASNIDRADLQGQIAPHLPTPPVAPDAGPEGYLAAADQALAAGHTGEAQQALEMAETRMLDRSTPIGAANRPDANPRVAMVGQALQALGHHDFAAARGAVHAAMQGGPGMPPPGAPMSPGPGREYPRPY